MTLESSVASASAARVVCEHGARCGGCAFLDVPEIDQLRAKREAVHAALARYPALVLEVKDVVPGRPNVGYRTRAKLIVAGAAIGLYARGSHDVVDIPHCRVLGEALAANVARVRELARETRAGLDAIDVRETRSDGAIRLLVTLIGRDEAAPDLEALGRAIAQLPHVAGVALSSRDPDSPAFFGATPRVVAGESAVRDQLLERGAFHYATFGSFTQAHRAQAGAIALRVCEGLARALSGLEQKRVLELYAGSGALSLALRERGARPTLVERFAPGLRLATRAAAEQNLDGIASFALDAGDAVEELAAERSDFDAVIVNPPRTGLESKLRSGIAALRPRALVYVSCDPVTLTRDLQHFAWLGYAARELEPYDLMPLTDAVETIAFLEPRAPLPIRVLYQDESALVVEKPAHLSTTPQGERAGSLLERVREQEGLRELHAVQRLDAGTSGVCLLSKRASAISGLAARLRQGEKHYVALARGITRNKGSVRRPLREGGRSYDARTRYTRLEVVAGHSLLRVRPDEGRKHQIRRHLAAIGHPLLGDVRHGDPASNRHFQHRYGLDRTFLHLARIELPGEAGRDPLVCEATLPGDLLSVLDRMRGS